MCIHHIFIAVSSLQEAKAFYLTALAPLGYKEIYSLDIGIGMGVNGKPNFWIRQLKDGEVPAKLHIAFAAETHEQVDAFHAAALAAGATDNGKPGLRDYTPSYYAAFIIDPQGNNIEAVNTQCVGAAA